MWGSTGKPVYPVDVGRLELVAHLSHTFPTLPCATPRLSVVLPSVQPDQIIYNWGGKQIYAADNMVKNQAGSSVVDLVAAFNAVNDPDLPNTASWTPALVAELTPVQDVPALVRAKAGPR